MHAPKLKCPIFDLPFFKDNYYIIVFLIITLGLNKSQNSYNQKIDTEDSILFYVYLSRNILTLLLIIQTLFGHGSRTRFFIHVLIFTFTRSSSNSENSGARVFFFKRKKTRHRPDDTTSATTNQPTHTTRNTTSLHDPTAVDHRTIFFTQLSLNQTLCSRSCPLLLHFVPHTVFPSSSGGCAEGTKYI